MDDVGASLHMLMDIINICPLTFGHREREREREREQERESARERERERARKREREPQALGLCRDLYRE